MYSLRRRIALFVTLASLLALVAGSGLTVLHYHSKVHSKSTQELIAAARTMPIVIELINNNLTSLGRTVTTSAEFIEPVQNLDRNALNSYLRHFLTLNYLDYAEVTDTSKTVLLNLVDSLAYGEKSANPLLQIIDRNDSFGQGILRHGSKAYITATLPIVNDDVVLGALTIGKGLDNYLVQELETTIGTKLAIWTEVKSQAIVSAGRDRLPPISEILTGSELTSVLAGEMVTKQINVGGKELLSSFYHIPELEGRKQSFYASYRSMEFLDQAGMLTVLHFIAILMIVVLSIVQFIFWISKKITRPITKLTDMTENLANMEFGELIPVEGSDEVSTLAKSFNHLSSTLKENKEKKDQYAADLAKLNEELESQVAKRTEQIEYSNLRLKREIAEKDDFLRAVSHDLGTPLRNIGGLAKTLERKYSEVIGQDGVDKIRRIGNNVSHELEMIGQLLELSRLKIRPNRKHKICLMEMLGRIRQDFTYLLEEKNIRLVVLDVLPTIYADRDRIRQVFLNLIDNAIKFIGDQSEPEIAIGWSESSTEHMFWISDNGVGVPIEKTNEIFGVFRRVKNRESYKIGGTGVGLTTVKSIVEYYNGDIWVESEPGKGSTFYFTLERNLVDSKIGAESIDETEAVRELMESGLEDIIS